MSDQIIQHAGRGHSELGPSSSERWLKCTPSAVLSAQFQDKPSVYAEEGTFLHELCELKLHRYLGDMTRDVIERQYAEHRDNDFYSDEAEEVTDVYVNHCMLSAKTREMISICTIDEDYAVEGKAVEVLWGNPGTCQMRIRAKVTLFPYIKEDRNDNIDIEKIPRPVFD